MPLFNEQDLRNLAQAQATTMRKSVEGLIRGEKSLGVRQNYDIFLSHSYQDKEIIYGLKLQLENLGFSVYVDWVDDAQLDRTHVTPATASMLRERMKACRSLLYALSDKSGESKWMPWELGYFDGIKEAKVAILPISADKNKNNYTGEEYLGLYYYVDIQEATNLGKIVLWINEKPNKYIEFKRWLDNNTVPYAH
jgi:TIR domain